MLAVDVVESGHREDPIVHVHGVCAQAFARGQQPRKGKRHARTVGRRECMVGYRRWGEQRGGAHSYVEEDMRVGL